jgi:hypothetical protein
MVQILFRLPDDMLERIDALVPRLGRRPELRAWGRASRAAVLRLLLLKGLEIVEEELRQEGRE